MSRNITARILIVEDDAALGIVMSKVLKCAGYETLMAQDGQIALRLYSEARFDLVISDMFMPNMDGVELIVALNKIDPAATIMAISGGGLALPGACLKIAYLLGAKATLYKPFTMSNLIELVGQTLNLNQTTVGKRWLPKPGAMKSAG